MNEARAIFAMGVASARARNEVPRLRVRSSRAGGGRKGHWSARFQDVTEAVIAGLSAAYRENAPEFIYFLTLYNIFHEFLEDISEDELPNEATGFRESQVWQMLYSFQRDAMLAIVGKLEKFNGCILADSVGLGKTLTALAVVKYYESRNKTVLVLCPAVQRGDGRRTPDGGGLGAARQGGGVDCRGQGRERHRQPLHGGWHLGPA